MAMTMQDILHIMVIQHRQGLQKHSLQTQQQFHLLLVEGMTQVE